MKINVLAFAVPLFAGFMLLEYLIAKKKRLPYFNLHNSIANVSIGVAERLCDVLITGAFYYVYNGLQKNYGVFNIKPGVSLWVLLLLCTDFLWYWYHRLAHEINILWAVHVVHHQSEDYNYTVSARITVLQALVRTCFWAVLPLLGFPAGMITVMLLLHGIYPFFIHTRLVGKLGVLEYILVTPSHHRVHHASNEQYLDKNYGDVFIIWDKLFGTFKKEEETEETVYGLTKPLNTYSFLWQHFHFLMEIWMVVKDKRGFMEKCKVVFGRPANFDAGARKKAEEAFNIRHSNKQLTQPLNRYVVWQMVLLLLGLFIFILLESYFNIVFKTAFVFAIVLTLINCGAIMEQKRWVFHVEFLRLISLLITPVYYLIKHNYAGSLLIIVSALFILTAWYQTLQKNYLAAVYSRRKKYL